MGPVGYAGPSRPETAPAGLAGSGAPRRPSLRRSDRSAHRHSRRGASRQRRRRGSALVAVLGIVLVLALIVLSAVFTVTLDTLAAGNVRDATRAEGQAEAALALAVSAVAGAAADGRSLAGTTLGPWPANGLAGTAVVVQLDAEAVRVRASAKAGRAIIHRSVVLRFDDHASFAVLARP